MQIRSLFSVGEQAWLSYWLSVQADLHAVQLVAELLNVSEGHVQVPAETSEVPVPGHCVNEPPPLHAVTAQILQA